MRNLLTQLWFILLAVLVFSGVALSVYFTGSQWLPPLLDLIGQNKTSEEKTLLNDLTQNQDLSAQDLSSSVGTAMSNTYNNSYVTNPVTQTVSVLSLAQTATNRLLYVNGNTQLAALDSGESGQVLRSRGSDSSPEWVNLGTLSADWASPGAIGATTPSTAVFTKATLTGESVPLLVGNASQFQYSRACCVIQFS